MANELKPMLAKVLGSGGEKKFFFAYGVGKRKDKKGDGELAIAGQKPKKPEIEGALDGCKEVMEGFCWVGQGKDDGDTIYFQCKGKKLSSMIVAKMALTAKAITTKQHDFQVPSEEEEARAEALKVGDSDQTPAATADSTPEKKDATPEHKDATPEKKVEEPASASKADPATEWKSKLAEWTPAIKLAITGKGPTAGEIGKLLAQANSLSKPGGDMAQALEKLTECHKLATATAGTTVTAGTTAAADTSAPEPSSKPTKEKAVTDVSAEWKTKLATWTPAIKTAMAAMGPNAPAIAKLFTQATSLAKPEGDMAQAFAKLTECHILATAGDGASAQGPTVRWNAARAGVVAQLQNEIKAIVATKDPDAGKAELELRAVSKQLGGEMKTKQQAADMLRYLKEDEVVADVCDLAFDLKGNLLEVLEEITPQLVG